MLREIAGVSVSKKVVDGLVEFLPEVFEKYEINTRLRMAHFLAQIAHESAHFRTLEEYASGQAYEGRRDLGNVQRGDGRRYKGRGAIQLTGRFNYRKFGNLLDLDLENNPELAASPKVSAYTAGEYWRQKGLNELADLDNVKQITRKINGGYNGLQDRIDKLHRAKAVLAKAEKVGAPAPKQVQPPVVKVEQPKVTKIEQVNPKVSNAPTPIFVQLDLEKNDGKKDI